MSRSPVTSLQTMSSHGKLGRRRSRVLSCVLLVCTSGLLGCSGATPYGGVSLNSQAVILDAIPSIKQDARLSCGPASMCSVLLYYGIEKGRLLQLYQKDTASRTCSYKDLRAMAQSFGFSTYVWRATSQELEQHLSKGRPVIILLQRNSAAKSWFTVVNIVQSLSLRLFPKPHWVVVSGYDENTFIVQDPGAGRLQLSKSLLVGQWEKEGCVALLVVPSANRVVRQDPASR